MTRNLGDILIFGQHLKIMSSIRGEWGEEGGVAWGPPGFFDIRVGKKCSAYPSVLVIKAEIVDGG